MQANPVALITRSKERVLFRSTLEARWAIFFDEMGFTWKYEPFKFQFPDLGFTYTPDFEVEGIGVIEVKPFREAFKDSEARIRLYLKRSKQNRLYLFTGQAPAKASVSILHGNPMRKLGMSSMQQNIVLGGADRREQAKADYPAFCDTIRAALNVASGHITTELLTIGELMLLGDTRDNDISKLNKKLLLASA